MPCVLLLVAVPTVAFKASPSESLEMETGVLYLS